MRLLTGFWMTLGSLVLLLLLESRPTNAYAPLRPLLSRHHGLLSAVAFGTADDSEWYAPPPPPVKAPVRPGKPLQIDLTTAEQLERLLKDDDDDRLIIIKFYASWCKSCAKVTLKMDQLAGEYADWVASTDAVVSKAGAVRFFNVEYGAARDLCQAQGIHQLPTIHMYATTHPGPKTKVQDFPCPPRDFARVRDFTRGYLLQQRRSPSARNGAVARGKCDLETKLNVGHDMIQASLLEEQAISSLSEDLAVSLDTTTTTTPSTRVLPRLWRRFRP